MKYKTIILLLLISSLSYAQSDDELKYDWNNRPKSITEQLGLKIYNLKNNENLNFDTSKCEIRIWRNGWYTQKIKLWHIVRHKNKVIFNEYKYDLTVIYEKCGKIIHEKYDSLLDYRLPVLGGSGVIGNIVSNKSINQYNETAYKTFKGVLENRILDLDTLEFNNCKDSIVIDGKKYADILVWALGNDYTVEIISKKHYKQYDFVNPVNSIDIFDINNGLYHANEILKIIQKKPTTQK